MRMVHATASLDTVERLVRIFARSVAMVKANASMAPACAWLALLVWIAACPFVVAVMATATSQMYASVIEAGQVPLVVFPCLALTQIAQAMVNAILGFVNVNLDGKVTSVKTRQWSATQCVPRMVHVIVQLAHAHAKQDGVATVVKWDYQPLQRMRKLPIKRRRQRRMQ